MGSNLLLIFGRVAGRSSGVRVSAVTALNTLFVLVFRSNVAIQYVVLALSVVASVAAVVVDSRLHTSVLHTLFIHGLRPGQVRAFLSLYSLLIAGLLSLPYVAVGPALFLTALLITFTSALAALSITYKTVKTTA